MFDRSSRYADLPVRRYRTPEGQEVIYRLHRWLPPLPKISGAQMDFGQQDRLDLAAARALGDPRSFWRLCDANGIADPLLFNAHGNRVLEIPEN